MKTKKEAIHFAHPYLINPTNPVTVHLIGAGGTGSHMLTALAKMNHALTALGHAGLQLTLWDDDRVSSANIGRQLFASSEIGLAKSVALINRVNRFFGTSWKAEERKFPGEAISEDAFSNVYVSCVDTSHARFEIAAVLNKMAGKGHYHRDAPLYWMDTGNGKTTGQVLLSTIGEIAQPASRRFRAVASLPMITERFNERLTSQSDNDTPSCSVAEALDKQDLFINPAIANLGASLFWQFLRNGMTTVSGFFINLSTFQAQPVKIS